MRPAIAASGEHAVAVEEADDRPVAVGANARQHVYRIDRRLGRVGRVLSSAPARQAQLGLDAAPGIAVNSVDFSAVAVWQHTTA